MGRPLIAQDVVRFVGDIVAIVISDDRATGADAAELVLIDYDPLATVVAPEDAARDEVLLFPEAGTNLAARSGSPEHDERLFDGCDVVVSGTLVSQRMAPCPLEPRSCAAELGPDGRITAWLSTQTPHQDRMVLAGTLGLDPAQVRVIAPDVGGGFGAKMLNAEEVLLVWLARPARPLDGDAQREHDRASARSRTAPGVHHRRDSERQSARLPARLPAGHRRVPGARSLPAEPDGADGERRLRDPADRV
jgi:carbon-monoxide dehydrogenase large subunit